jgi:hypothetical protein
MMMVMMRGSVSAMESASAKAASESAAASAKAATAAAVKSASAAARAAARSCHISILQKMFFFFARNSFAPSCFILAQMCSFVNTKEKNLLLKVTHSSSFFGHFSFKLRLYFFSAPCYT